VGEALRARGATVTFAGTADRVESRLVPEAGFELDTFPVSGIPRELSPRLLRAIGNAARAPFACRAILRRRRPDVVLGAGGYVAGPMVLAARLAGIPAALTEADAHLGLANRLAAPLARRVYLAYAIPGRDGARYEVVGRPIPLAHRGASRAEGRSRFGLPPEGPGDAVFGVAVLLALWTGASAIEAGRLAAGDLVLFMLYALMMRSPIVQLTRQGCRSGKILATGYRLSQLLERGARPSGPAVPVDPRMELSHLPAEPVGGGEVGGDAV
jgi:hypothetical protein